MTAILLNVLALALVLGISWLAMAWLARKVHGDALVGESEEWVITRVELGDPCPECSGVGAQRRRGALEPCRLCEGTGEITALPS